MGGRRLRGGARQENVQERDEGGGGGAERVHQEIQQHHLTHCRTRLLYTNTPLFQLILQSIPLFPYQGPRRGATPEEDLRRMHVREEEVYRGNRLVD